MLASVFLLLQQHSFTRRWVAMIVLVLATPFARADLSDPGPYPGGWRTVTVTRVNATTFNARMFYPSATSGQNTAIASAGGPFPVISFGHGFLQSVSQYQSTCLHLATHGYVVIASESEGSLSPNHANFANDLSRCLTYLEQEHVNAASPLFGRLDLNAMGMSGHSMGGGASTLAAAGDLRVKALITMAAAETNPSAVAAAANLRIPASFITGSADTIVAPGSNGQLMYNAAPPPRQLPLITGGYHCGFVDANFLFCDSGSITRAAQLTATRSLLTAFFNLYLKRDQSAWGVVWGAAAPASTGTTLTSSSGITIVSDTPSAIVPPGAEAIVTLTISNSGSLPAAYSVFADVAAPGSSWSATPTPTITPTLAPGQSSQVSLLLQTLGQFGPASSAIVVSARSELDGGTRAFVSITAARSACLADWNGAGGVSIQDLFDFLTHWFAADPRADLNGGGVTVQDLFDYLSAWFGGCV